MPGRGVRCRCFDQASDIHERLYLGHMSYLPALCVLLCKMGREMIREDYCFISQKYSEEFMREYI